MVSYSRPLADFTIQYQCAKSSSGIWMQITLTPHSTLSGDFPWFLAFPLTDCRWCTEFGTFESTWLRESSPNHSIFGEWDGICAMESGIQRFRFYFGSLQTRWIVFIWGEWNGWLKHSCANVFVRTEVKLAEASSKAEIRCSDTESGGP